MLVYRGGSKSPCNCQHPGTASFDSFSHAEERTSLFHLKCQVPFSDVSHFDSVRAHSPFAILSAIAELSHGTAIARAGKRFIAFTEGSAHGALPAAKTDTTEKRRIPRIFSFMFFSSPTRPRIRFRLSRLSASAPPRHSYGRASCRRTFRHIRR